MTEHRKKRNQQTKLPCQWVEEEGFEVKPAPNPATEPPALSDTAFLLKSNPLRPPPGFRTP